MTGRACLALAALAATASAVRAEPRWAVGVSVADKHAAEALWNEANALLIARAYAPAVEKYRAALARWDHPKIQLNLAMTLIGLERYLEASDALSAALRYGAEPYAREDHDEALNYKRLLDSKIGTIEVRCEQRGVQISLDGKPWFRCPGTRRARVLVDEHTITGELADHLTATRRVFVAGGETATERLSLVSLDAAVTYAYRVKRWVPWTIAGTGTAVALAGLATWYQAGRDMDDVEGWFRMACPAGCDLATQPALVAARDAAERKGSIGLAIAGVGGAVALGGVVAVIWNRPVRVTPSFEISPDGTAAASLSGRF